MGCRPAGGSREFRYQESPRRRTWTKIALALASLALLMTARTWAGVLSVVLKVSTQKPRYSVRGWACVLNALRSTPANAMPAKRIEEKLLRVVRFMFYCRSFRSL